MATSPGARAYPSWIEICGFKALRAPARVELRPLTLLAGANSSGKSSIFQPLLLIKQSLEVPYEPDPLLLDGPHVAFTSLDQFLSRGRTKSSRVDEFSVVFGAMTWPQSSGVTGSAITMPEETRWDRRLVFRRRTKKSSTLDAHISLRCAARGGTAPGAWVDIVKGTEDELANVLGTKKDEFYLSGTGLHTDLIDMTMIRNGERYVVRPVLSSVNWLRSILHLPGLRGHRERRYPVGRVAQDQHGSISVVGPMHRYAASILLDWKRRSEDKTNKPKITAQAKQNLAEVNKGLAALGLTWKVVSKSANAAELELRVGRVGAPQRGGAQDLVDLADVGFGLSQVLPVLVGLAAAAPGQLVLIEQPELHLHPRAQLAMGGVLAAAAARGVIVVVETHSQLILRAIQTIVAKKVLTPSQVSLNWCTRDPETGWSTVDEAELGDDGTFGEWPVDFPDVFSMADGEFLDAVFATTPAEVVDPGQAAQ